MAKIHLLLLDGSTLSRVMLSRFLDEDPSFQVSAECSSIPAALKALARKRIDLVLFDRELENGAKGLEFIRQARHEGYAGRIFIMTAGMTATECVSALAEAVCGIFFKHNSPQLLVEAIHKVMAGQTWIDQSCIQLLSHAVAKEGREARQVSLTDREVQVLKGVLGGLRNRQIGVELRISEASVKSALQQLFVKTGVRTRTQLVRIALQEYGAALGPQA
jgi:two-component system, NarL family, nitrate/nitrite response regulator NarL